MASPWNFSRRERRKRLPNLGLRCPIPARGDNASLAPSFPKSHIRSRSARELCMWDFSVGKAVSAVIRTTPFILLRLAVYFGIGFAYLIAAGVGAVVGYGFGHMGAS